MNTKIYNHITVFCASSARINQEYNDAAYQLGTLMAKNGIACVCGAGNCGLMRSVADGCLDNGGRAIGVIPRFMVDNGWCHPQLTETIVTEDMHQRKETMNNLADAIIALPGGCGTLEELLEIITWRQLGIFHKPIVILNTNGYYDHLLKMLQHCIDEQFMKESHSSLWIVANTPEESIEKLLNTDLDIEIESKY